MKPRADFPLSTAVAAEILSDILVQHHNDRNRSTMRYEARRWAEILVAALRERGVGFSQYPKIVPLDGELRPAPSSTIKSSRRLRVAAHLAWHTVYQRRQDPVEAFAAALRETLEHEPRWSIEDAARHTIRFVLGKEE